MEAPAKTSRKQWLTLKALVQTLLKAPTLREQNRCSSVPVHSHSLRLLMWALHSPGIVLFSISFEGFNLLRGTDLCCTNDFSCRLIPNVVLVCYLLLAEFCAPICHLNLGLHSSCEVFYCASLTKRRMPIAADTQGAGAAGADGGSGKNKQEAVADFKGSGADAVEGSHSEGTEQVQEWACPQPLLLASDVGAAADSDAGATEDSVTP
ncbi:uncharacterized protein LOC115777667 [Archocentrus centrarchus]|uniref:uncharacterized protein LOC115777667 n=1 Tax=Archocentrus centrarchus TaxID=63155 RepID=UPI0011E9D58A|nr:uncharacterized protein LOC115777667 [Archocentrus centrarchus]